MSNQSNDMKERDDILKQYVSDMLALEQHIADAVERQVDDREVLRQHPEAQEIIATIETLTERHNRSLKEHLEELGGDPSGGIKEAVTSGLGAIAGFYDKLRSERVSKMLRDDYTALNHAAISYTMLYTTGLALNSAKTADLALRFLQDYTPVIVKISEAIPKVVAIDLRDDAKTINESSVRQAVTNTQKTWQRSSVGTQS